MKEKTNSRVLNNSTWLKKKKHHEDCHCPSRLFSRRLCLRRQRHLHPEGLHRRDVQQWVGIKSSLRFNSFIYDVQVGYAFDCCHKCGPSLSATVKHLVSVHLFVTHFSPCIIQPAPYLISLPKKCVVTHKWNSAKNLVDRKNEKNSLIFF